MDENLEKAKEIIGKIIYITLATISKDGSPWNSPVYSAFDENYNFFWVSPVEALHSKNIRDNNNVAIAIYDSTVPEGTGRGVYIKALAYELSDGKEIEHALPYLYGRKNKPVRPVSFFMGDTPRRVYKAVSGRAWINGIQEVKGQLCDLRIEISLNS